MAESLRTFIAIPIVPSPSLKSFIRRLDDMPGPVKAVNPDQLHLTMKFLGDTSWVQTVDVGRIVSEVAAIEHGFDATIRCVGAFPHLKRPRVVWAGVEPEEPLSALAGVLNELIGELGFPREERHFQAHVTLARIKGRPPAELFTELEARAQHNFGGQHIDRLVYYQSELSEKGPRYTVLSEHALA